MDRLDLPDLGRRLNQIADALGARQIPADGLLGWLDALAGERYDDVQSVLTDWLKTNSRMPTPEQVLKRVYDRVSDRVEAQAEENRRTAIGLDEMLALAEKNHVSDPAIAQRELAKIWAILHADKGGYVAGSFQHIGGKGPGDDHKEWARVLRVRHEAGEHLNLAQIEAYKGALGLPRAGLQPTPDEESP